MSDLSDKKSLSVTESIGATAELGAQMQPKGKPVQIWAAFGGAILLLQLYVWTQWVTGPYFEQVPAGPTRSADVHEDPAHRERRSFSGWACRSRSSTSSSGRGAASGESRWTAC